MTTRGTKSSGRFNYGGGHVIEELVAGKDIRLEATAYARTAIHGKKLENLDQYQKT